MREGAEIEEKSIQRRTDKWDLGRSGPGAISVADTPATLSERWQANGMFYFVGFLYKGQSCRQPLHSQDLRSKGWQTPGGNPYTVKICGELQEETSRE